MGSCGPGAVLTVCITPLTTQLFALFALFALVPAALRLLWSGDYMHYAMGGMAILFLLAMLATGKRIRPIDQC
jgi:hypothetical protein